MTRQKTRAKKSQADALRERVDAAFAAGQAADQKAYAERQAKHMAEIEELERSGAHDRVRWLNKVQRGLEPFYKMPDPRIAEILRRCRTLISGMFTDVRESPHHEYEYVDRIRLKDLMRDLDELKHRKQVSEQQRKRASKPKKEVTRDDLVEYRQKYIADHGTERGWMKSACAVFSITPPTLRNKMGK